MFAVDDGLVNGNLDAADIFFLVAVILAVVAAIAYGVVHVQAARLAPVLLSLAVASVALAWLVL
jgi:uncharacterized membrane protein